MLQNSKIHFWVNGSDGEKEGGSQYFLVVTFILSKTTYLFVVAITKASNS